MWSTPVQKIAINVPFKEKDEAKALGARWDANGKTWYYTNPADADKFAKWLPQKFMSVEDLSDEQKDFIGKVMLGKNVLVDACIGSGKTTAIQVLCNELYNKKILYLTYNALLKEDARDKIKQPNTVVTNYHGFAYMCLAKAAIPSGVSDLIQTFLKEKPPLGHKYDILVLDEYQDIEQEIAEMLEYIKEKCPDIQIVAVGDMKQKIYDKTTLNVPEFINKFLGEYELMSFTKCFRLSENFAARLGRIWEKDIKGVNPNCTIEEMNVYQALEFLRKQKPADVLCLGARSGNMSDMLNILERQCPDKYNKQTVYASIADEDRSVTKPSKDTAIFTTFDSSKGLERRFCLVFDYTESYWITRAKRPMVKYEIIRNIFLVAASRGKERIIFVKSSESRLSDETLASRDFFEQSFDKPFDISSMFSFKYKEDIEDCYKLVKRTKVENGDTFTIGVEAKDGLIDLSPCIGIWQEAAFFQNYDIDSEIAFAQTMHDDRPQLYVPKGATVDEKVLYLTSYNTCYDRYVKQVDPNFLTQQQRNAIFDRLRTVFDGSEDVQRDCRIGFLGSVYIECSGRCDVIKDNAIYELKFVTELAHEDFLQLACYIVAMRMERGYLWNIKNNAMYEVRVPDRKRFLETVLRTITKGTVVTCRVPDYYLTIDEAYKTKPESAKPVAEKPAAKAPEKQEKKREKADEGYRVFLHESGLPLSEVKTIDRDRYASKYNKMEYGVAAVRSGGRKCKLKYDTAELTRIANILAYTNNITENGAEVFLDVEEPDKKLLKALNESRNSFSFLLLKEKLNDMYCIAIRSAYKVEESGSGDDFTEFIYAKAAPLDDDTTERDMIIGLMQSAS